MSLSRVLFKIYKKIFIIVLPHLSVAFSLYLIFAYIIKHVRVLARRDNENDHEPDTLGVR